MKRCRALNYPKGKVDVSSMGTIAFLASDLDHYELGEKAGQAFKGGVALK